MTTMHWWRCKHGAPFDPKWGVVALTAKSEPGKVWAVVTVSGGTPTVTTNHNVTSIADDGVGHYTLTFTTAFSSANYAAIAMPFAPGGTNEVGCYVTAKTTTTVTVRIYTVNVSGANTTLSALDSSFSLMAFGAQ